MRHRDASGLVWHCAAGVAVVLAGLALPMRADADIAPGLACGTTMPLANRPVAQQVTRQQNAHPKRRHYRHHAEAPPPAADATPAVLRAFFTCPTLAVPQPGSGWRAEGPVRLS
jgi:hypothetical protein